MVKANMSKRLYEIF